MRLCSLVLVFALCGCGGSTVDGPIDAGGEAEAPDAGGDASADGGDAASDAAANGPECAVDDDCVLVDDCCRCEARPADAPGPLCDMPECFAPACLAGGIGERPTKCVAGRCVLDVDCDASHALCKSLPSPCPAGEVHAIESGCWGACVPAVQCAAVRDCADCAGSRCVRQLFESGTVVHCVEPPAGCSSDGCACLGPSVCAAPFSLCIEADAGGVSCACPTCRLVGDGDATAR